LCTGKGPPFDATLLFVLRLACQRDPMPNSDCQVQTRRTGPQAKQSWSRAGFPAAPPPELLAGEGSVTNISNPTDNPPKDWLLWQLADSAFPSGGFAHSGGLEAAVQQGELRRADELRAFLVATLQQIGHASLPFVTSAYDHPEALLELDRHCDSFLTNHVANRASRLQGQATLASAERIFGAPELRQLRLAGTEHLAYGHLAPVFGFVMRVLGLPGGPAARLFCFLHLRGLVSGAVRLGVVGPLQAQALQHDLASCAEEVFLRCRSLATDEIAQTAPLLDLWQANQDRLYSRLFQS
jgi:urease accessory protein